MPSSTELRALEVITACAERGEPLSSYAELAAAIGLSSRSRVSELIAHLEKEGLIEVRRTTSGRVRTATIRPAGLRPSRTVPVLGRVAAGVPILAQTDELVDLVSLPANRASGAEVYMLEVKGESMIGDGILEGDHVVVAVDPHPAQGSIAVILIGEEATVKHVYYERDVLRLKSSNPAFSDLVYGPEDNPIVQGRVIGVVRWLARA
ncbi:MAG TPA: S24 family peptidase [Trebonia sp.]